MIENPNIMRYSDKKCYRAIDGRKAVVGKITLAQCSSGASWTVSLLEVIGSAIALGRSESVGGLRQNSYK